MTALDLLPDLPDKIQGIKSMDPFVVQCPACGTCHSGHAIIAARRVPFNDRAKGMGRMCLGCWADHGWYLGNYASVRGDDPEAAHAMLNLNYPGWNEGALTPEEARALIANGGDAK